MALRIARERRIPRGLAIALASAIAFWVLAGLNRSPERFPTSSHYQYPSAVFLLLVLAETMRGLKVPRLAIVAAAVVAGLSIAGGLSLMHREYRERWKPAADATRFSLAGVDIAGSAAQPGFPVTFPPATTVSVPTYLSAVDKWGSPTYTERELAKRPESERAYADLTIAQALGLALGNRAVAIGRCNVRASALPPMGRRA